MQKLVIIGCSEIAKVAYEYFTHDSQYQVVAFAADKEYINQPTLYGKPVVDLEKLHIKYPPKEYKIFIAINGLQLNRVREKKYNALKRLGYSFASYVSSKAFVWQNVEIGDNCFILENNTLQPFVKIGNNVTLWSSNHIGHGSIIHDHVFVTSHVVISGLCEIESNTFIGVNACIADTVKIAKYNFIAMGSVLNKSTKEDSVVIGNPAIVHKVPAKKFCKVND